MSEFTFLNCKTSSQLTKLCLCCLRKDVTFVNLPNCKHFGILEKLCSVKIPNKELGGLVCYYCHAKLKTIYDFKIQAEESFTRLWSQQYTATEKPQKYEEVLLVNEEFNMEYEPEEEEMAIKQEKDDVTEANVQEVFTEGWLSDPHRRRPPDTCLQAHSHRPPDRGLTEDHEIDPLPIVKVDVNDDSELLEQPRIRISNVPNKVSDYHIEVSGLYADDGTLSDLDSDDIPLVRVTRDAEIEEEDLESPEEAPVGPEKLPYRSRRKGSKRLKGDHKATDMLRGIRLYRQGLTIRKAADKCGLSYSTLNRYIHKNKTVTDYELKNQRLIPNYSTNKVFTEEHEALLLEIVEDLSCKFYGLSGRDVRCLAYQMANVNNMPYPANWEAARMAGSDWLRSFKYRHSDLSLQTLKASNLPSSTEKTHNTFFSDLKNIIVRHPSLGNGCRIYNLDETEMDIDVQLFQNVLKFEGLDNLCKSSEKRYWMTTCAIVSASGQALPPALIFPKRNEHLTVTGAPTGSLILASNSGRMDADLFPQIIEHFIKLTCPSVENPALLIFDNNKYHLSIRALDLAQKSGVCVLIAFSKMLPLDGLNGKFKSYFNRAIESWLQRNRNKEMTVSHVAECATLAYQKSMTPVNIAKAFEKCGIFPYDDDV